MDTLTADDLPKLTDHLRRCLHGSLPGRTAHLKIIPASRHPEFIEVDAGIRSAVLLLLYPYQGKISTVFIQRPHYQGYHSGQISLPGGKFDPEDSDLKATALREAWEETNIQDQNVSVLGALTRMYIPPSGFQMTPFLAVSDSRPDFRIETTEVAKLIEADISLFRDVNLKEKEICLHDGRKIVMPYYDINGHVIWGATGMVMSELSSLLASFQR
jgi:8-oxo-dGTP pyrophosphatase MutT (NUDIX family)